MEKIGMEVTLQSANFNIYKYQKLAIAIIHQAPDFLTPTINKRISGDWLVVGIEYTYTDNNMAQNIKLVRRDLGLLDDEKLPSVENTTNRQDDINNNNSNNEQKVDISISPTTEAMFKPIVDYGVNYIKLEFSGGDGQSYLIIMKEGDNIYSSPIDGKSYKGDSKYAYGDIISDGEYIVYSGASSVNSIKVVNLKPDTTYYFDIYTYNTSGDGHPVYLTSMYDGSSLKTNMS